MYINHFVLLFENLRQKMCVHLSVYVIICNASTHNCLCISEVKAVGRWIQEIGSPYVILSQRQNMS